MLNFFVACSCFLGLLLPTVGYYICQIILERQRVKRDSICIQRKKMKISSTCNAEILQNKSQRISCFELLSGLELNFQ